MPEGEIQAPADVPPKAVGGDGFLRAVNRYTD